LLRWQDDAGITGGVFEIGVFAGKYLSLLYQLSTDARRPVLGLDTFQWYPREKVIENFDRIFGQPDRLLLLTGDSTQIQPAEIQDKLGGKPCFISVDGAHTATAVLNDLNLSQQILADGGIVAIDDLLNPRAIGVSEGAYRYFLSREKAADLAPFAYCANKLFAAHRRDVARFHEAAWQFTRSNPTLKVVSDFNQLLAKGRDWVEQQLLGCPVLIL
jgi:hypothetical protein